MWQKEALGRPHGHLGDHLTKDGVGAVRPSQTALRLRPLHLYAVQLDDWPVLPVADHRCLNDLPERILLQLGRFFFKFN